MRIRRIDRIAFGLSAVVLAFLYGYGASRLGWFPAGYLEQGLQQAASYLGPPPELAPRIYERSRAGAHRFDSPYPGLTLVTTHAERWDWRPGLMLLDEHGDVVHEWPIAPEEMFGDPSMRPANSRHRGVHGAYLFPDGDVMFVVEYLGVARMNSCGEVVWQRKNTAHHAISPQDDGTFWLPTSTPAETPTSAAHPEGYPGWTRPVNHDHLVRITGDGEVIDSISMLDVLYANDLARFLVKRQVSIPTDILHVNDVEPLSSVMADDYPRFDAGDLLVSVRASSLVLVLDPDTEVVKWHSTAPWFHQHDPDFIGGGWIGVFDNARDGTPRGSFLGGSRIVAVQPHTGNRRELFPGPEAESFYTRILGKWQLLENDHLLLTEGEAGRIVEVDSTGRTVWEWIHPGYDDARTVEVTEGTRYDMTPEDVAGWPCSRVPESRTARAVLSGGGR